VFRVPARCSGVQGLGLGWAEAVSVQAWSRDGSSAGGSWGPGLFTGVITQISTPCVCRR